MWWQFIKRLKHKQVERETDMTDTIQFLPFIKQMKKYMLDICMLICLASASYAVSWCTFSADYKGVCTYFLPVKAVPCYNQVPAPVSFDRLNKLYAAWFVDVSGSQQYHRDLCTKIKDWKVPSADGREAGTVQHPCDSTCLLVEPDSTSAEPPGNFQDFESTLVFKYSLFFSIYVDLKITVKRTLWLDLWKLNMCVGAPNYSQWLWAGIQEWVKFLPQRKKHFKNGK